MYEIEDVYGNEVETVFILESPHTEEINQKIPACGITGKVMSSLLLDREEPLGILIANNTLEAQKYGIINSVRFPLSDSISLATNKQEKYQKIKNIAYLNKEDYSQKVSDFINEFDTLGIISSLKIRLENTVRLKKIKRIYVCGLISQIHFKKAFPIITEIPFNKEVQIVIADKSIIVKYLKHPSPKNSSPWKL